MKTIWIGAKNVDQLSGKSKEDITKDLLTIESETGNPKKLEYKLKNDKYSVLFAINDNKNICGYIAFRVRSKYIEINTIKVSKNSNFDDTIKNLIDSIRSRPPYLKCKWIRMWVLQDYENINLCKALCKYGFHLFPDDNDMTRFFYKESFNNPKKENV